MKKLEDDLTSPEAMNAPLDEIERLLRTRGPESGAALATEAQAR
ncbi:MAG: hypothetical protein NT062_34555 [Proteobacteria bacterium]|nr:hypothetical protein [Pseudomonadota bacterium]